MCVIGLAYVWFVVTEKSGSIEVDSTKKMQSGVAEKKCYLLACTHGAGACLTFRCYMGVILRSKLYHPVH